MKKVKSAKQIAEIVLRNGIKYPFSSKTIIELDKKSVVAKKEHGITFQQERYFGTVGDYCHYISHDELFELEEKGMIKIN